MTKLAIVYRPVASLVPYARNARTHSDEQVAEIAASVTEYGWTNPVLLDKDDSIIAGHGRVLAARKLEMEEVPCIVLAGLSDAQKRAYRLADNKMALNAGWDPKLLGLEFTELREMDFNLNLTGFGKDEIRGIVAALGATTGLTDPDAVPEAPEVPTSASGDLWRLGEHRLLCGDSTNAEDVKRCLGLAKPHLMVTDPPYGVDYDPAWRVRVGLSAEAATGKVTNDDRADWQEAWGLFKGDVAYVWHAGRFASEVQRSLERSGFDVRNQIIWAKTRFSISRGHYHWQHEPCWYVVRKGRNGHWSGDRKQSTIWEVAHVRSDTGHGTQKPVECMRRPIENNSVAGEAIYEPFLGSGTTMIAAEMEARTCHAIEVDPVYVDVAVMRWQEFTGEKATLDGGPTFDEVTVEREKEREA
jgi:DNA modification methylase